MACIIDSWVPTASITECAPKPSVRSLIAATPSAPRSVTMSVAPNSSASCCRGSCRLIAMIRSAPSSLRGQHPEQPDRAVADHGDGLARPGLGGDSGEPTGAEHVGGGQEVRHQILGGNLRGGDQGAVGQRHPHPLRLRGTGRAEGLTVGAGGLVAGSADLAGVVGGEERPDDELARLHRGDRGADLFHDAGVLVTHRAWPVQRLDPAVRPQVRPADAGRRQPDDRIGRLQDRAVRRRPRPGRRQGRTSQHHAHESPRNESAALSACANGQTPGLISRPSVASAAPSKPDSQPSWESLSRRVPIGHPSRAESAVPSTAWTTVPRSASS